MKRARPRQPYGRTSLIRYDDLRTFGYVGTVAEIPDVHEPITSPLQQNEIRRRAGWVARIAHEKRGPPVHQRRAQSPVRNPIVVVKVSADLAPPVQATLVDEFQPHLVGEQVADGVEVARIETIDVGRLVANAPAQSRAVFFSSCALWWALTTYAHENSGASLGVRRRGLRGYRLSDKRGPRVGRRGSCCCTPSPKRY